jgi:hypothetical protein
MTTWYVHRRADGSIASAHEEPQAGYAEERVDEASAELQAILRPVVVPQTASAGDFVSALLDLGWYDAVDAAAKASGGRALILWNRAATFERQHPIVRAIGAAIGKTDADLDALFLKTTTYAGTPENV